MIQWRIVKKALRVDIERQIYYHIRHIYRQVRRVRTWQLLLIFILGVFVSMTFLRLNNIGMAQRRAAVLQADKDGRDGDLSSRMLELQHYVTGHMNASTGPFYLEELYNRDAQRAIEAATDDTNPSGNVNVKAREVCDPQFSNWSPAYVQCFIDELNKYPSAPNPDEEVVLPNAAAYRHSYASPLWSRDFAGFSVLVTAIMALIIVGRALHFGLLHVLLRLRRRGIGS